MEYVFGKMAFSNMKGKCVISLIILILLINSGFLFAQKQRIQVDILAGGNSNFQNVGLLLGLSAKNVFNNGYGFYFHTDGIGTAYTGETGIDYRSICDRVNVTDEGSSVNTWGMSLGLTYDLSTLLKVDDSRWTLFVGTGFAVKEIVKERYEYYIWDDVPSLNEGNYITWIHDSSTLPIIEAAIGYELIRSEYFGINVNLGYATTHGVIGFVGFVYGIN